MNSEASEARRSLIRLIHLLYPMPQDAAGTAEAQVQNQVVTTSTYASSSDSAIPMFCTDPDMLDCPICLDGLSSPIYQCGNGHITCSSCYNKVKPKCHLCCLPISRFLAMENLLESIRVKCEHAPFGCKEMLAYHKKSEHKQTCLYTPCFCPFSSCGFFDSSKNLYAHFSSQHTSSAVCFTYDIDFYLAFERSEKHIILQERNEGAIFILNHDIQGDERVFDFSYIRPSESTVNFVYKLHASFRESCLKLEAVPEVSSKWQQHTTNNNLTIPCDFTDDPGQLLTLVHIKKVHLVI